MVGRFAKVYVNKHAIRSLTDISVISEHVGI